MDNDDLSWFFQCGPDCSCGDYVAASFGNDDDEPYQHIPCPAVDSLDDDEHVERLVRFAEAGGWEVGDV